MSLILADARQIPLRDGCVQCVVTSPPYWGLRDYGSDGQIGLEATPDAYVQTMVSVFREVRRVLTADGVCWLNLGDSYATGGGSVGECPGGGKQGESWKLRGMMTPPNRMPLPGLKPKDLVGIPWRVALALQADGWYLRSDIIWSKPNPMPESVTDRPTKAHEYLFLLTKSERYYYNADAIAEPVADSQVGRVRRDVVGGSSWNEREQHSKGGVYETGPACEDRPLYDDISSQPRAEDSWWMGSRSASGQVQGMERSRHGTYTGQETKDYETAGVLNRNRRSVWTVNTMPYAGAHFATMPEKLVEPCILAGSRLGDLVFDPFLGSGTVGAVAERLGRRWVGTDLNPAYHALARERTSQRGLRFEAEPAPSAWLDAV